MNEWLIWSIEHAAWWRPDEMGYTASVYDAGRYSQERAAAIVAHANIAAFQECMIPVAAVGAVLAARLRTALEESVRLQSHYAALLNMHDGGQRIGFTSADAWIARLVETGTLKEDAEG